MSRSGFCVLALLLSVVGARAEPPDPPREETPAAAAYKRLAADWEKRTKEYLATSRAAETEEEKKALKETFATDRKDCAARFLAIGEKYPKDAVAVDALSMAVRLGHGSPELDRALSTLTKEHVQDSKSAGLCRTLAFVKSSDAEKLLRAVLDKNPADGARGRACYALALRLQEQAQQQPRDDAEKAMKEAEALYEQVVKKYADVAEGRLGKLGDAAKAALFELRNLAVGKVAPDIEGEDVDGKKFKLSDYRGKVVVLDFWGHWCPDCRGTYPQARALVKRLEKKPFALLGVNSDTDREQLKKVLAKNKLTWRAWWDGGSTQGPIATTWHVYEWPTIYVLDHKGVIRHKGNEELAEKLEKWVDALLKERDEEAGRQ